MAKLLISLRPADLAMSWSLRRLVFSDIIVDGREDAEEGLRRKEIERPREIEPIHDLRLPVPTFSPG